MPNITIVKNGDRIDVDFGDYATPLGFMEGSWWSKEIKRVERTAGDGSCVVKMGDSTQWELINSTSLQTPGKFIVDSIDTTGAPTTTNTNALLMSKLRDLMA